MVITIPVAALLLLVAFGSQSLHRQAMRNMVGERDLRTVQVAATSIEQQLIDFSSRLQILSRDLKTNADLSDLILSPDEITSTFDGGLALYTADGKLINSLSTAIDWTISSPEFQLLLQNLMETKNSFLFSDQTVLGNDSNRYILVGKITENGDVLVGAFSTNQLVEKTVGSLVYPGNTTILIVAPDEEGNSYNTIYQSHSFETGEFGFNHPGIRESLNGASGTDFFQTEEGEHVIAFAPIPSLGWGIIGEEAWENITNPNLSTTQYAPLVIVPVFLLSLLVIWFGASRIVSPLQKLEKQAASLADGNFEAIQQPVGGIEEIQTVQAELKEMATRLKDAQQNLRSYIGAMTEGIENERRSLAREIHDDTIQSLIVLNQRIQILMMNASAERREDLEVLLDLMKKTMENLRRMIRGLRPIYLEDLGLATSLDMLVREMEQSAQIPIKFKVLGDERRFTPQVEMSFYRMAQESLNNVLHHAGATQSSVTLSFTETELTLRIQDDGKGFIVPKNPAEFPKQGHFGLLGLQERAELINAELSIISNLGAGTIILIRLPLNKTIAVR
jgi:signal transduction histidine kinase